MSRSTRLAAVPDAAPAGVGAVPAGPAEPSPSPAAAALLEVRGALRDALADVRALDLQIAPLREQLEQIVVDRGRLEAQRASARQPLLDWQRDPTSGPCPRLGEESRRAIREADDALAEAAERERAISGAITRLDEERSQALRWAESARAQVRQAALAVLASDVLDEAIAGLDALLPEVDSGLMRLQAIRATLTAQGFDRVRSPAGVYEVGIAADRVNRRISAAVTRIESLTSGGTPLDAIAEQTSTIEAEFERLVTGVQTS